MKKKIFLFIFLFLFITNVKALTFNIDVTDIEDKGNNGTIGLIETINVGNKNLDVVFHDKGDEVNFLITITNTGSKVKLLRSISFESGNPSIKYTSNIPETGLVIDGFDKNEILVTARLTETPVNGKSASKITIRYVYEESVCPKGEVLSDDERTCLCLDGTVRNDQGMCVKPEKPVECAEDEIYNEEKKICEKKVLPVSDDKKPISLSNPQTRDNIILTTLFCIVCGLGIYALMFKDLNTNKKKVTVGVITGVVTLGLSFAVLTFMYGLDNILGALADTISDERVIVVDVNEEIDLIETWDGDCDITGALTPENIFEGGSGTEDDPYQIYTANQLACFAKSVNEGTTYEGQFIKQTRSIKLNDSLNEQATSGDLSHANVWAPVGHHYYHGGYQVTPFKGTYDGDNQIISGLYIVDVDDEYNEAYGLFGAVDSATLKNIQISDAYLSCGSWSKCGAIAGAVFHAITIDNVVTYGNGHAKSGIISKVENPDGICGDINIYNSVNNINGVQTGFLDNIYGGFKINMKNLTNNGSIYTDGHSGGIIGDAMNVGDVELDNVANKGNIVCTEDETTYYVGGLAGQLTANTSKVKGSYNTGNITNCDNQVGGLFGQYRSYGITIDDSFNSGNITNIKASSIGGLIGYQSITGNLTIKKSFNTGNIEQVSGGGRTGGLFGQSEFLATTLMEDCFNTGDITAAAAVVGGITADSYGLIKNTYNKGNITIPSGGGVVVGGIVGNADYSYRYVDVENSYNEGNINISGVDSRVGGICGACGNVTNSYNLGNIIVDFYGKGIGGITGRGKNVTNSYNTGDLTITKGGQRPYSYITDTSIAGIMPDGDAITNSYNIGNVTVTNDGTDYPKISLAGIGLREFPVSNSVNTGNVKFSVTKPFTTAHTISLYGIASSNEYTNNYNSGLVELDDSALDNPISTDDFNGEHHTITISNTINDSIPDILSIINGDNAFEIKQGETLPTLKVFN